MKRNLGKAVLFGALLFFWVKEARGQDWTRVYLPNIYKEIAPYFLNENIGFVFDVSNLRVQSNLLRTTDGGASWSVLHFFDDASILINQIYFVDLNHGYAATSNGVYETQDIGNNWKKIYTTGSLSCFSVYAFGNKVFAFCGMNMNSYTLNWGPLLMTDNNGNTWDTIIPPTIYLIDNTPFKPYVFGNKDNIVFAENIDASNNMFLVYSSNNGNDWSSNRMDSSIFWNKYNVLSPSFTMGLFSFPHCKDLLRAFLTPIDPNTQNDDVDHIVHSSDFGTHWDTLFHPIEIGAWIAGNNCVQFVSNASGPEVVTHSTGVIRSQDHGKNWVYFDNGPDFMEIDDQDFHNISVVGGGAVVYASDVSGVLWKTTDGSDGTLSALALASHISLDHNLTQGYTICDTSSLIIIYQNLSCNYTLLKNFNIDGLDTTQYSSEWRHHLACDGLSDSVLIKIFLLNSNAETFTIHEHFMNDEFQTIDTSFTFTLSYLPGVSEGIYLKSKVFSGKAGDTVVTPIFINSTQTPAQPGTTIVTLTYSVNTDLLTPFAFIPISGVTADPVKITKTTATVTLHFDPSFTFSGETELGRLRCVAYVTDTLETDIMLTGAAHSSGCLATLTDSNFIHFTLTGCGTPTLSKFIKYGTAYDIVSIVPNPAGNSIQVQLKNNGSLLNYKLLDALGAIQKNGATDSKIVQLDLSGLSSGNYYFRLSGEGVAPITKRVVVAK
jgi:hypothetical protein